ncbi:hypothetical protein BC628DRAFT_1408503 [Trametes gibbosa]|nr:hypothetical protein BC628DRAFT_1408503 [Trametes gibbosa]
MSVFTLEVTKEIKLDHDNVRDLYDRFRATTDLKQKATLANTLVREMAIHGDAEDLSVYNDYSAIGLGDAAAHNKEDHAEIKRLIETAAKTSFDHPQFTAVIERAVTTFLTHAKEEEDDQHPLIRKNLSAKDSDRLARAFLKVRKLVLAREQPSPGRSGDLAQKIERGQVPVRERLCDTVAGRDLAPLRFAHPDI